MGGTGCLGRWQFSRLWGEESNAEGLWFDCRHFWKAPGGAQAIILALWQLHEDWIVPYIEPRDYAFDVPLAHGGASTGSDVRAQPNVQEDARTAARPGRGGVMADDHPQPILAVGHQHVLGTVPVGIRDKFAVEHLIVVSRVCIIDTFERRGALDIGHIDAAHFFRRCVAEGGFERKDACGSPPIAFSFQWTRLRHGMDAESPTQAASPDDDRNRRTDGLPDLIFPLESLQFAADGIPSGGDGQEHLLGLHGKTQRRGFCLRRQ